MTERLFTEEELLNENLAGFDEFERRL